MDEAPAWLDAGMEHIWLPYTQMKTAKTPLPVVGAEGCRIKLADGRELVDGIASWWSACHGYNHPHIRKTVEAQLRVLPHVMFAGLAHAPAYELAARLAKITPDGLERVFFSDSGSVAVEVAMKMAVQYWKNQGKGKKCKFIAFRRAYHGDTMGPMSLADPEDSMHRPFTHYVPKQYVTALPLDEYGFSEFTALVDGIKGNVAALVMEPLVQGAGGMRFHGPDIVAEVQRICKEADILFIADEIFTGFGRTGSMFACEEAGITPDILCLGKALTGGTMTLAATMATGEVFDGFLSNKLEHALMHGPTFMANPLACAAAHASLDLFEKEPRLQQVLAIEMQLREKLWPCKDLPAVKDVRVMGAIGVVQLQETNWEQMFALREQFAAQGVWIRPFGDVVYLTPPFTINSTELSQLTSAMYHVLETI